MSAMEQRVRPSFTEEGDEPVPAPRGTEPSTALQAVHLFPEPCAKAAWPKRPRCPSTRPLR